MTPSRPEYTKSLTQTDGSLYFLVKISPKISFLYIKIFDKI
jgi:hypothetical protein